MNKFEGLPRLETTQPDRLLKFRVSEDKLAAEILFPGFSYTDFDQKIGGKLYIWALFKLTESSQFSTYRHGLIYFPELFLSMKKTLFVLACDYKLSEEFHHIRYINSFGFNKPINFHVYVSDVGRTSFAMTSVWVDHVTRKEIASVIYKIVVVDPMTRKPTAIPDIINRGLADHLRSVERKDVRKRQPIVIPDQVFRYTVKVLHSDLDRNEHANQATYIRWSSDAASTAAIQKRFKNFHTHIELYPYKSIEVNHFGECLPNDELVVSVWEDDKTINAAISKNDQVIYTTVIKFYDGPPTEVDPHLKALL